MLRAAVLLAAGGTAIFLALRWAATLRLINDSLSLASRISVLEDDYRRCLNPPVLPEEGLIVYPSEKIKPLTEQQNEEIREGVRRRCLASESQRFDNELQGQVMKVRREYEARGFTDEVTCGDQSHRMKLEDCTYDFIVARLKVLSQQLD